MNIKAIIINNWMQNFTVTSKLQQSHQNSLDVSECTIIKDDRPSLVIQLHDNQILKLVRARQWVEYLKLIWNHSRISKEIKGNRILNNIGICVPKITETALGLLPQKNYRFIGYYIMADLTHKNFMCSKNTLANDALSIHSRQAFFHHLAGDIKKMRDNNIVFNDFKLGNVFCNKSGDATWIDTGVTIYPRYKTKKFKLKHNFSMNRFIVRHQEILTEQEKQMIQDLKFK